ncbi:MAG: hypothetical protein KDA65_04535 [Planctomycetaceae bacterium]|nr:hypothetical protein [Planctomycetaceae bacterium]
MKITKFTNWSRLAQGVSLLIVVLLLVAGYFLYQFWKRNSLLTQVGVKEITELQTPGMLSGMPVEWQYKLGFDRTMGIQVARDSQLEEALELLEPEKITTIETYSGSRLITDEGLKLLSKFPNLRKLQLWNTSVTDEGLEHLAKHPNLEELIFDFNTEMTGSGIRHLKELSTLKRIEVRSSIDPLVLWDALCEVPQVAEVEFGNRAYGLEKHELTNEHLQKLTQPVNWNFFLYHEVEVTPEMLPPLRFIHNRFPVLRLKDRVIDADVVSSLCELKGLQFLDLINCTITDEAAIQFSELNQLQRLTFEKGLFPNSFIESLSQFPTLSNLAFTDCPVDDVGLKAISTIPSLRTLRLTRTNISDAGLVHLGKFSQLSILELVENDISDVGISSIEPLLSLHLITIRGSHVRSEGVEHLAQFKNLAQINLNDCPVEAEAVLKLNSIPQLQSLGISEAVLDAETLRALKQFPFLGQIEFKVAEINPEILKELSQAEVPKPADSETSPSPNPGLRNAGVTFALIPYRQWSVDLSGTEIKDADLLFIARNNSIGKLNLSQTSISDEGMTQLATPMASENQPKQGYGISNAGPVRFSRLTSLDLSHTHITDESIPTLLKFEQLRKLNLADTSITAECLPTLKKMAYLQILILDGTLLSSQKIDELRKSLPGTEIIDDLNSEESRKGALQTEEVLGRD